MRKNSASNLRLRLVEQAARILGAVLLSTLVSLPAWPADPELRCQELGIGGACSCSESYDSPTFTTGVGGSANANSDVSPAVSECHDNTGNWYPASALTIVDETGMPAGNTVNKVWKTTPACGGVVASGDQMRPDRKRVCVRSYQKLSRDYYDNGASGGKWQELTFDSNHSMQYGHNGYGATNFFSCRITWEGVTTNCTQTGALTAPECLGEWCRVEMCVEGDFVNETGPFYLEGYWQRVSDGKRRDVPYQLLGNATRDIAEGGGALWPANLYRGCEDQGCQNPPCQFVGNREVSHIMQAEWPVQSRGLFIGAAYEIEGGVPDTGGLPPPSGGSLALTASAVADVGGALVTSVVSGGTGPYQYLFDCNLDGNWDGVVNDTQAMAEHVCPLNGQGVLDMIARVWDQTTDAVGQASVHFDASMASGTLGKPGQPVYVSP